MDAEAIALRGESSVGVQLPKLAEQNSAGI